MNNDDFAKTVMAYADDSVVFQPAAFYNPDGDCIEFFATQDSYVAERIDERLTVYLDRNSGRLVGCMVKGVSIMVRDTMERLPGLAAQFRRLGKVRVADLLRAALWSAPVPTDQLAHLTKEINGRLERYEEVVDLTEREAAESEYSFA